MFLYPYLKISDAFSLDKYLICKGGHPENTPGCTIVQGFLNEDVLGTLND